MTGYVHACNQELTFGATGIPNSLFVLSSKPRECFLPLQRLKMDSLKRMDFKEPGNFSLPTRQCKRPPSGLALVSFKRLILQIYTEYIRNNTGKLYNDKQGTYLHSRIKIYVQDSSEKRQW